MDDKGYQQKEKEARALGYEHGRDVGSWVFDGNSSEGSIRRVLQGFEDGDPEIMEMQPSPLSGEWAGDPTPASVLEELDVAGEDAADDLLSVYEEGFSQGYWDEVIESGRGFLPDEEQD